MITQNSALYLLFFLLEEETDIKFLFSPLRMFSNDVLQMKYCSQILFGISFFRIHSLLYSSICSFSVALELPVHIEQTLRWVCETIYPLRIECYHMAYNLNEKTGRWFEIKFSEVKTTDKDWVRYRELQRGVGALLKSFMETFWCGFWQMKISFRQVAKHVKQLSC